MRVLTIPGVPMASLLRWGAVFAPEDGAGGGAPGSEAAPPEEDSFGLDDEAAEDAFMESFKREGGEEADPAGGEDNDRAPDPEQGQEAAPEDPEFDIGEGETASKAKLSELRAAFLQRTEAEKAAVSAAEARTQALAQAEASKSVLQKALERAEAKFKPYGELDFFVMAKRLDEDSLAQLRKDAKEAYDEVAFLREEMDAATRTAGEVRAEVDRDAAQTAIRTLTAEFPAQLGEEWGEKVYGEILEFAEAKGLKGARSLVDPAAIKLLRMAQLYERGKVAAKEKVKKVAEQPRKPLRSGTSTAATQRGTDGRFESAITRLRQTGSAEDAEDAFLARLRG